MYRASVGGRDAARSLYRHALIRIMTEVLPPFSVRRGWSMMALAIAAVLMSWSPAPTITQRFSDALAALDGALPRRRRTGRTYQGFIKALMLHSGLLIDQVVIHLRTKSRACAGKHWQTGEFVSIGVDCSKFDAPRTQSNEPLGMAGKDKCCPQMVLLLLFHLGSRLPWGWRIGDANSAERTLLRDVLDQLPPDVLLVADAGFTGYDLLCELQRRGLHFLIRVGNNVRLLKELGEYSREGKHTVYLWPLNRRSRRPLTLRLIQVGEAYLVTNVLASTRLSKKAAGDLYRRRWKIEIAFRSLKQTLQRHAVRSGTARRCRLELAWTVIGLWTLCLIGAVALARAHIEPQWLSVAAALSAVRDAARRPDKLKALRTALREARLDEYRRKRPKASRNWPRKKNPPQIKAPVIATATAPEVGQAQRVKAKGLAI